jgi:uncharacterized protein (DUF983 family)
MRRETVPALPAAEAKPRFGTAILRGLRNRCPHCGEGRVFDGYLKVVPACAVCGTRLGAFRADDAPPYFVIFLVGHLVMPLVFMVDRTWQPPMWLHMVVWLPLFTVLCMALLRPVKGGVVGWMYCLGIDDGSVGEVDRDQPARRSDG